MHLVGDREGLLPRGQRRLPGVEATEVEAHMHGDLLLVCYKSSTAACLQAV